MNQKDIWQSYSPIFMTDSDNVNIENLDESNFRLWVKLRLKGTSSKFEEEKIREEEGNKDQYQVVNGDQKTNTRLNDLERKLAAAVRRIDELEKKLT